MIRCQGSRLTQVLGVGLLSCCPVITVAQQAENNQSSADQSGGETMLEEVVVLGSQIKGADVEGALPVTMMTAEDIAVTGATSGDELLRSIPQMGEIGFNESVTTGVNAARGDVSSVNLRGLGTGNTLVLINGRRMVLHPGTQTENFVPVVTANSNTLPVRGIERVEVLRDGAAAIYGTDAVAGVVNYVLKDNYEGGDLSISYGASEGTDLDEVTLNGARGFAFNDGSTHLTLMGTYYKRNGMPASDRDYAENSDLRPRVAGDPLFEGDTSLDNRSGIHGWGEFIYEGVGRQHVRPTNLTIDNGDTLDVDDCSYELTGSLCLDPGGADRALRANINDLRQLSPDVERFNVFGFLTHDFDNGLELYSELGIYNADTERSREPAGLLSNGRFSVPADYYWNPLGPVNFDDGRVNPNRVAPAGDPDVPDEGLPFVLRTFRPFDVGPRKVTVDDESYRFVAGLRGNWGDWDWDTGLVYSAAKTVDSTDNRVSHTLFQQSLSLDTADAYNLFNGLDASDTTSPSDPTPNPAAAIAPFLINVERESETSLTLADIKLSNPSIVSLPAGDVGIGLGVEWRQEDFDENRDSRSDGSVQFTDQVTGEFINASDIMGSSASPDADGDRRVTSVYVEFLVPLLSDLPLVQSLDAQIAGRYEDFSDVGDVAKPKFALAWRPLDWLQVRSAYSEGFRAPNLTQIHQGALSVVNTRTDPVTGESVGLQEIRVGSKDLEPEENESLTAGIVLTPFDGFTFTLDYWRIEQEGVIGIFGGRNALQLDATLREQGSFNPDVVREVTTDGSIGEPISLNDVYRNFQPRTIKGIDFSVLYNFDTMAGNFDLKLNGAYLQEFEQEADSRLQTILDSGRTTQNVGSLVKEEGRPRWRASASVVWHQAQWGAGLFASYVGEFNDPDTLSDDDTPAPDTPLPVDDYFTMNGYVDYQFEQGAVQGTRIRLGVRNMFDEEPPLADEQLGYQGNLHSNRGRYLYLDINKRFD